MKLIKLKYYYKLIFDRERMYFLFWNSAAHLFHAPISQTHTQRTKSEGFIWHSETGGKGIKSAPKEHYIVERERESSFNLEEAIKKQYNEWEYIKCCTLKNTVEI